MNNKLKRSIAVVLTAAAICNSLGTTTGFSKININSVVASAADVDPQTSGTTNKYFYSHADGYSLYFSVTSSSAKTATLTGCTITKDTVNITIPETANYNGVNYKVTSIGENAFRNQKRIENVWGNGCINEINSFAFAGCTNLSYVSGLYNTISIGNSAFMNCSKLEKANFLDKAKKIGDNVFRGCTSLECVYAPKLESMGSYAFAYCYGLTEINLENSTIKTIPEYAFAFIGCSKTKTELIVNLPSTVQTIGNYAFYDAQRLEFINLSNVTQIGANAFTYCWKLKTVLTSDNLSSIGSNAFNCCDALEFFVCKNPNVSIGSGAFGYRQGSKGTNIVLWGSNGGGNVKKYAANNGLTYKNTEDAAKEAVKNFEPYVWTCGNTSSMFGDENGKYLLTEKHKAYVEDKFENKEANGSCYGMAAISALVYNGYLKVEKFATKKSGEKYTSISTIDKHRSDFTCSFINSVFAAQNYICDYALSCKLDNSRFDVKGVDAEMLKYIEYITYGADVATVSYYESDESKAGHALVCLGMEFYDNASDKSNTQWENGNMDARILLYDVNNNKFDNRYCMYVNLDTGEWVMGDRAMPEKYSSDSNKTFGFKLDYKPDSMISYRDQAGVNLLTKLIRAK